jgi:hypothetical protein
LFAPKRGLLGSKEASVSEPVFVPAENLQFISLTDAKSGHLFLSVNREPSLFWIVENEGHPVGIFLSGSHAGHGFETAKGSAWSGVLVGPVEVRVDVTSAHDGRNSDVGLVAENGTISTHAKMKSRGFDELVPLVVAKAKTSASKSLYFTRFSLGRTEDDEWHELARWDAGEWSGPLVPKPKEVPE